MSDRSKAADWLCELRAFVVKKSGGSDPTPIDWIDSVSRCLGGEKMPWACSAAPRLRVNLSIHFNHRDTEAPSRTPPPTQVRALLNRIGKSKIEVPSEATSSSKIENARRSVHFVPSWLKMPVAPALGGPSHLGVFALGPKIENRDSKIENSNGSVSRCLGGEKCLGLEAPTSGRLGLPLCSNGLGDWVVERQTSKIPGVETARFHATLLP